MDILDI